MDHPSKKPSPVKQGEYHKHDVFEDRAYEVNEMDKIMLDHLDIEGLLKLYQRNPKLFTQYHLNKIADRFSLDHVTTFNELVYNYDSKYATLRSLLRKGVSVREVILRAAKYGNIEVVTIGLKTHPELQNVEFYNHLLEYAGESGNRDLILLLEDLGANDREAVFLGAAKGGHLNLVKEYTPRRNNRSHEIPKIYVAIENAVENSHLDVLEYVARLANYGREYIDGNMFIAGRMGNSEIIDYLISKGATYYTALVDGLATGGHLALVKKFYNKPNVNKQDVFYYAIINGHLDVAKYVAEHDSIDQKVLNYNLNHNSRDARNLTREVIKYLLSLGYTNYNRVLEIAAVKGYIDLLEEYYDSPGVNLNNVFYYAAKNLESLKFLVEVVGYIPSEGRLKFVMEYNKNPEIKKYLLAIEPEKNSTESDTESSSESDTDSEETSESD